MGITGSYAGAGIQYIVPAALVYLSRKQTHVALGVGVTNHYTRCSGTQCSGGD